ncbi:MAG: hypothetical protein ACPG4Z_04975 [Chitinophagales bacterium]
MGKYQQLYTKDNITLSKVEALYKEKFGDKYEYTAQEASKGMLGSKPASLLVVKNAYHRTNVRLTENEGSTFINFDDSELVWWLGILRNNLGFIGALVIDLIYGDGDGFYGEVESVIRENFNIEVEEINTGIGALFGKK